MLTAMRETPDHSRSPATGPAEEAEELYFDATLSPHRSLSPRGFLILMSAIAGCGFAIGTGFALMGAWPVFGFAGLEVLLVYIAFRLNYRSARAHERLRLTSGWLEIARVDWRGSAARYRMEPAWLTIDLARPVEQDTPLLLRSRGMVAEIGRFLTPQERVEVADALTIALARMKSPGLAPRD